MPDPALVMQLLDCFPRLQERLLSRLEGNQETEAGARRYLLASYYLASLRYNQLWNSLLALGAGPAEVVGPGGWEDMSALVHRLSGAFLSATWLDRRLDAEGVPCSSWLRTDCGRVRNEAEDRLREFRRGFAVMQQQGVDEPSAGQLILAMFQSAYQWKSQDRLQLFLYARAGLLVQAATLGSDQTRFRRDHLTPSLAEAGIPVHLRDSLL